jgi:hypothetical protein
LRRVCLCIAEGSHEVPVQAVILSTGVFCESECGILHWPAEAWKESFGRNWKLDGLRDSMAFKNGVNCIGADV